MAKTHPPSMHCRDPPGEESDDAGEDDPSSDWSEEEGADDTPGPAIMPGGGESVHAQAQAPQQQQGGRHVNAQQKGQPQQGLLSPVCKVEEEQLRGRSHVGGPSVRRVYLEDWLARKPDAGLTNRDGETALHLLVGALAATVCWPHS